MVLLRLSCLSLIAHRIVVLVVILIPIAIGGLSVCHLSTMMYVRCACHVYYARCILLL